MRAIYFPFTYVADRVAEALAACFGSFVVYQPLCADLSDPMQAWQEHGIMEVRVPVAGDENELLRAIQSFRIWADLHGEDLFGRTAKFKARTDSMALLSGISSSQIVAEIKDHMHGTLNRQIPDRVQVSRIFLYFAQEFDRQNYELADELARSDRDQAELIRQLKIEDDPVGVQFANAPIPLSDFSDDYLVADRLDSWSRIFLQEPDATCLLVTHSPAVLEHLLDCASTAVQVLKTDITRSDSKADAETAVWQEELTTYLKRLLEPKRDDKFTATFQQPAATSGTHFHELTVYQVPDQSPQKFLSYCTSIEPAAADSLHHDSGQKNTLIALLRI